MPYSKNYPKPLTIWVSDEMFQELTRTSEKSGVPKTKIIREGIARMTQSHRSGLWGTSWNKQGEQTWTKEK